MSPNQEQPFSLLRLELPDAQSVIFRGIVGSRAYGTSTPDSDTDIRGIFITPPIAYVSLAPPPPQVSDAHNDRTYYSLLRFCELAAAGNPKVICKRNGTVI